MFTNEAFHKIFLIGIGSFLGGNARFWLGSWLQSRWGHTFPVGTFTVNISGALLLGLFSALLIGRPDLPYSSNFRLFFAAGFLGSYTTFSALEYETFVLVGTNSFTLAALNAFGSLTIGFLAIWLGIFLGRLISL